MSKMIHEIYSSQSKKSRTRIRFQKITLDEIYLSTIEYNKSVHKEIDETDKQPLVEEEVIIPSQLWEWVLHGRALSTVIQKSLHI